MTSHYGQQGPMLLTSLNTQLVSRRQLINGNVWRDALLQAREAFRQGSCCMTGADWSHTGKRVWARGRCLNAGPRQQGTIVEVSPIADSSLVPDRIPRVKIYKATRS